MKSFINKKGNLLSTGDEDYVKIIYSEKGEGFPEDAEEIDSKNILYALSYIKGFVESADFFIKYDDDSGLFRDGSRSIEVFVSKDSSYAWVLYRPYPQNYIATGEYLDKKSLSKGMELFNKAENLIINNGGTK